MPATSCLTGLIGLSRAASPCFPLPTATPPVTNDYITTSASGLYLDEVEGLRLRPAPNTQPGTDAWQRFDTARTQAVAVVESYLRTRLTLGNPVAELAGTFGGLGDGTLVGLGQQPTLKLPTRKRPGLGYVVDSLSVYASVGGLEVSLLLDGVEVGTLTTNAAPVEVEGITIPFDGKVHTISVVLPEGVRARNNTLTCGCSDSNPNVALALAGLRSETDLAGRYHAKAWGGGFVAHMRTTCTNPDALCFILEQDEQLRQSVAFALLYKTAELLTISLVSDGKYERYTSLEPKALQALAEHFYIKNHGPITAEDAGHLTWLTSGNGLARVQHPCYCAVPTGLHYTKRR